MGGSSTVVNIDLLPGMLQLECISCDSQSMCTCAAESNQHSIFGVVVALGGTVK